MFPILGTLQPLSEKTVLNAIVYRAKTVRNSVTKRMFRKSVKHEIPVYKTQQTAE